ncbi:hypothetical protein GY45DRAFT_1370634 [Cubamyces sp. BRFM 1775]|nr:hypothetical protein GY45DRAFT_1370634 [Cubamyces sp. BRFM 1775]
MQSYTVPSQEKYGSLVDEPDYSQPSYPNVHASYAPPFDLSSASWPLNYSYFDPGYLPYHNPDGQPESSADGDSIPLHAPVPISGYTTLLASPDSISAPEHLFSIDSATVAKEVKPIVHGQSNPLDVYLDAPQVLFPTPSELLMDLNSRELSARAEGESSAKASSRHASRASTSRAKADVDEPENLNQRKAYFRSVSETVGFTITDPDTITSHDKKRCYLECLEEYVQWLHEQLRLVGQEPLALERVSSYRGLKSRSIRTMLVHKQEDLSKLNDQKLQAEQKFMELQNALLSRQMAEVSFQGRRHSVGTGAAQDVTHGLLNESR